MSKERILERCRRSIGEKDYPMPDLSAIHAITYDDPLFTFKEMSEVAGCKVIEAEPGYDLDEIVRRAYPDAKRIASNIEGVTIATINPDKATPQEFNGTDVGVIRGELGVAENACVWVPQAMNDRAVCFISENLVLLLRRDRIVNNMHEAYARIKFNDYGYGCFISGPSKTADIAQVLVMGAQAARSVTLVLLPEGDER